MKVVVFVVSIVIFLGSLYLFGLAFSVTGWEVPIFVAGLVGVALAYIIPFHILKRIAP